MLNLSGVDAMYTMSGKKGATLFLPVTLQNVNQFSKFFYHYTTLCSKFAVKESLNILP